MRLLETFGTLFGLFGYELALDFGLGKYTTNIGLGFDASFCRYGDHAPSFYLTLNLLIVTLVIELYNVNHEEADV